MRASTIVMTGFAVAFGVLAVFIAEVWLNHQADQRAHSIAVQKPVAMQTIVVAAKTLHFGTTLTRAELREIPWPKKDVPAGTFATIKDILSSGRHVVLTAIEKNEPILALKITGPGQRATLSALVKPGMKAVTIRVNDVDGVGGFVMPGDHVDVILTRTGKPGAATTEVVLQDIKVLAVDQTANERDFRAKVARSVTLQVSTIQAQKLWLASSVGSLSLLLRKAGDTSTFKTRLISLKDLVSNGINSISGNSGETTTVVVTRPNSQKSYTVPVEGSDRALRGAAQRKSLAW